MTEQDVGDRVGLRYWMLSTRATEPVCAACRVACWPSPARLLDMVADPTVEALGSHAYAAGRNADYLDPP